MKTAELLRQEVRDYLSRIKDAATKIRSELSEYNPSWDKVIFIVLGSGLGSLAERVNVLKMINYSDIPGFPRPTVEGHEGKVIFASHGGKHMLMLKGRFHYYEGYDMLDVTFPVRVVASLGIKTFIVTNAAGGLNSSFELGDIMLIRDHIGLFMPNPLRGPNLDEFGPRFLDMHKVYDEHLIALAKESASELGVTLKEGVYVSVPGPTYETPAEIKLLRTLGADAVGMSTVPEVIVARHSGMRILGFSVITDVATEVLDKGVSHEEVLEIANKASEKLQGIVLKVIERL